MTSMPTGTPPPPPPPNPGTGGGDIVYPQQPPKDPILILVLNLFVAGCVGYFMIGQKNKAIVALIAFIVGFVPPICGTLSGLVAVVAAIDGYLQAQHLQAGHPVRQWTFFNNHA
jgi:hypothetical protein